MDESVSKFLSQQVGVLRLSEAIRIGCEWSEGAREAGMCCWTDVRDDGRCFACVIGAAFIGATGRLRRNDHELSGGGDMITYIGKRFGVPAGVMCVAHDRYENQGHSRLKVADWLQSIGY